MSILDSKNFSLLQQVFSNLSVAAFAIDDNHRVILWNKACEKLTGIPASEVIGTRDHWRGFYKKPRSCLADTMLSDGLEDALKIYPHVSESQAVPGGLHAENWCVNQSGEKLYLLFEAGTIRNDDGEIIAVVETLRDTTQPKLLNDIQRAIGSILDFSFQAESLEELLKNTLDLIHSSPWLTVVEKGFIHLIDKDYPDQLLLRHSKGISQEIQDLCQVITLGNCLTGQTALQGEALFSGQVENQHYPTCDEDFACGQFCVPIKSHGVVLGVLNTYTPASHQVTPGERVFLENISQALANGIERWQSEKEIQEAKETLSKAEQMARMGSWNWLAQDNKLRVSDEGRRLLGIPDEITELTIEDLLVRLPPKVQSWIQLAISGKLDREVVSDSNEHMVIRPDGTERVVQAISEIVRSPEGHLVQIIGTMLDISERKRAEEVTLLLGRVLGGSMNAIYIFDSRSLKFLQVSEGARRSLGYSFDALSDMTLLDLASDLDPVFFTEQLDLLHNFEQERVVLETTLFNRAGEPQPVELRLQLSLAEQPPVFVAVTTSIKERLEEKRALQRLAHFDALTGLPNRMLFHERLNQTIAHCKRKGSTLALMFMDLDKFKAVNDSLGHDAGDLLLKEVSSRISGYLREVDTLARLGGDEFTVILSETASPKEASIVAKKIINLIKKPFYLGGKRAKIGTSIGIALFPKHGADPESLIKRADLAMYAVKKSGRNGFKYFNPDME
ncbi:MAG: diguanylate cyclase [Magnetococcales bacterium]|nr:diguanylate cyclase [Magnetococcales bacterium]